ncbi:MAG: TolC family protein [bacterium]
MPEAQQEEEPLPESNAPLLSFEESWQKIQAHYPLLKKQNARLEEALALQSQAVSGLLPKLQGNVGWKRTDDPTEVFMSKLKQRSFTDDDFRISNLNHPDDYNNYNGALRLEIPLFDAFQTIASMRTAKHLVQSRQEEQSFTRMEASLLAIEAYLNSALAERLLRLASVTLRASEKDLKEAQELKEQGLVVGADFFAGRVASSKLQQTRNALTAHRRATLAALNILQNENVETAHRFSPLPELSAPPQKNMTEWIAQALLFRSDLAALQATIKAKTSELGREKAKWLPRVSAFGQTESNTRKFEKQADNYTVGVQGTVDLFDPAYSARVKAARAALEQLQQDDAALRDEIARTVAEAASRYDASLADAPASQQAAQDAKEAVALTEKLYREGRKSIADLQAMRAMALEAESAAQETVVRAESARSRLLFLSGQLDDFEVKKIASRWSSLAP